MALRWLWNALRLASLIAQQSALSLRHNWGLGLLSLVLATSLWVYVTDRENPERVDTVSEAVPVEAVNVPPDRGVCSLSQRSVTVRVRAPEGTLEDLTADDFRATIDLSAVEGDVAVPVDVEPSDPDVRVVDVSPARVTVRLESLTTRTVPARANLQGALPQGFEVQETTVDPEQAVVTGPACLVTQAAEVVADVNLTGVRSNLRQTVPLQVHGDRGGLIQGVEVEPANAAVQVAVRQVAFSVPVTVLPTIRGVPADGYDVRSIQVDPPIVVATAPAEVLQSLDPVTGIPTEAVSVDGASADVVRTVALSLPANVRVIESTVTVRVNIEPARGQVRFSVVPHPTNLGANLRATIEQQTVQVVLAGAIPDLSDLSAADVVATLDLRDLPAGEHTVPVQVQPPANATVVSITPPDLRVTLAPP